MTTYKVLMVEDQIPISDMYKMVFEKFGFTFEAAADGLKALTKISNSTSEPPDVIVLDLMMPTMDGLEMLRTLRKTTSNKSKIIVFSNLHDDKFIQEAYGLGVSGYLIKAHTPPRMLLRKVAEILNIEIPNL